jgi:hypothetical protein
LGNPEAADLADLPYAADVFLYYDDEFRVLRSRSGVLFNSVATQALREKLQANADDREADPFAVSFHRCRELRKQMKRKRTPLIHDLLGLD